MVRQLLISKRRVDNSVEPKRSAFGARFLVPQVTSFIPAAGSAPVIPRDTNRRGNIMARLQREAGADPELTSDQVSKADRQNPGENA